MPDDPRAPLDARWRQAMARLGDPLELSPELEARVRASLELRKAGAIRGRSRRAWVAVAALALVLVAGALLWPRPPAPSTVGSRYLLLLYEGSRFDRGGATHQQLVGEYRAWAGSLAERGKLVEASELGEEERLVGGVGESTHAAVGTISGFFIVRAVNMTEAAAIAATCPHLKYGGEVSIRPLREE